MPTTDRTVDVASVQPIAHGEGQDLFGEEMQRAVDLLGTLTPVEWATPVPDCPAWDVRRLYLHVLGAAESGASFRELAHQLRAARSRQKLHGGPQEAALSAVQVGDRDGLTPEQLVARLADVGPRAAARRRALPALVRRATIAVDGPVVERWRFGYLVDVIYLRDAWMHRADASRALHRPLQLTAEHDGRVVADVVAEWCRRHGAAVDLVLTGPAGGRFVSGSGPRTALELDAVEFCRALAGRADRPGLLSCTVPF